MHQLDRVTKLASFKPYNVYRVLLHSSVRYFAPLSQRLVFCLGKEVGISQDPRLPVAIAAPVEITPQIHAETLQAKRTRSSEKGARTGAARPHGEE